VDEAQLPLAAGQRLRPLEYLVDQDAPDGDLLLKRGQALETVSPRPSSLS
jgi:hypothetical protein